MTLNFIVDIPETIGSVGNDGEIDFAHIKYKPESSNMTNFMAGNIAEVLIYTECLSDGEVTGVEGYLKDKWGL